MRVDKIRDFTKEFDYNDFAVIRVHNSLIPALGGRRSWVRISCGKKKVYRTILGLGGENDFTQNCLELDYDSRCQLGLSNLERDDKGFFHCDLLVEKVTRFESPIAYWHHPNPAFRVGFQLGSVGLILAVVALFVSLAALM